MICGEPVKDWILEYLSIHTSAPIKAIYLWLEDAWYTLSQAQVYNIINSMLEAKMLTKQSGKVRLSARRIEDIHDMARRLHQHTDRDGISIMAYGEKKTFTAKTFHEINAIWHDISAQLLHDHKGNVYYYDPHPYHLLGEQSREEQDLVLGKKEKAQLYYVIWWDSCLDLYGAGLAQQQGIYTIAIEKPLFPVGEFWAVVGEYVYQVILDKNVTAYLDMFFATTPTVELFRQDLFYALFDMKGLFTFTLWRDEWHADVYKQHIMWLFHQLDA